ncbi:MAG TPA: hypothetical protein VL326_15205 [Kofleriaceae bacterium]|nr:hypothetical protein [Kofleriaceae bacterium]
MRRVLVLLGLCGCDALFGLDSLDYKADAHVDVGPDGPRTTIHGTVARRWLHQDELNQPFIEPGGFTGPSPVTARHRDGSDAAVTWSDDGTFSFEVEQGERYTVILETSLFPTEFQASTPMLALDDAILGRPDQVTPGPSAGIEWDNPDTALPASAIRIATTGIWSLSQPTGNPTGSGKFLLSTPTAGFVYGQKPALIDGLHHDSLWILHYASDTVSIPNTRLLDLYSPFGPQTQAPNTTSIYNSMLNNVSRPFCLDATWNHSTDQARLAQRHPNFTTPGGDTRLWAVPRMRELGTRVQFELALVFGGASNGIYRFQYGNPFAYDVALLDNNYVSRTLAGVGTISAVAQYLDIIAPQTSCVPHGPLSLVAPLPYALTLNGFKLTDNLALAVDGVTPIELKWSIDPDTANTVSAVSLIENTKVVRTYYTLDSVVYLSPKDLSPNVQYRVSVGSYIGHWPNAAAGDFFTRSYPLAVGAVNSGLFTISTQ